MIDDLDQVQLLITAMRESLPLVATVTPEVAAAIRAHYPATDGRRPYPISRVDYAGDEGGIMCRVDVGSEHDERVLHASITHLRFGQNGPIDREIAAYQKRRVKRLRRSGRP